MGALARSLYALHRQAGHGRLDFSSIQSLLRAQTEVALACLALLARPALLECELLLELAHLRL